MTGGFSRELVEQRTKASQSSVDTEGIQAEQAHCRSRRSCDGFVESSQRGVLRFQSEGGRRNAKDHWLMRVTSEVIQPRVGVNAIKCSEQLPTQLT